ncbi:MAG: alanine/glycine:cation symporter family protein [Candidatus Zixiibacteriota bacterium]
METSFVDQLSGIISSISSVVWGVPMVALIMAAGLVLSVRNKFVQFRGLGHSGALISGKYDKEEDAGELTHFQALTAALAATVGIGNIAGVATAIYFGGPGAIFWMWVSAALGMAIKFSSCTLAVKYREIGPDGSVKGGPMYFIEKGLGKKWKPLAIFFAVCTALAALGAGNGVQSNTIAASIVDILDKTKTESEWLIRLLVGIGVTTLAGVVIIGGIKRIGRVAEKLVPFMSVVYVGSALVVLLMSAENILPSFGLIFKYAFNPVAATGGAAGFTVWMAVQWGMKRGVFSNEAGLGSSPMAHAAVKVDEPVKEGLVAMLEPFVDTIIICTMTALVIISSGLWSPEVNTAQLNGSPLTSAAFEHVLPGYGRIMVTLGVLLFGFSTILTWSYYGEKGVEYIGGANVKLPYKLLFLTATLLGATVNLRLIWNFADVANALMALPNIIGLIALSGVVAVMGKKYFRELREGKHRPAR